MRILTFALLANMALLALAPAKAEQTVTVPDDFRTTLNNVNAVLERCIGATAMRSDNSTCGVVQNFLQQLNALPMTPVAKPEEKKKEEPEQK